MRCTETVYGSLRRAALGAAVLAALAGPALAAAAIEWAGDGIAPAYPAAEGAAPATSAKAPPARLAADEASDLEGEAAAVASFGYFFDAMNENAAEVLGEPPFESFENMGARTMRVIAGKAWMKSGLRQQRRTAVAMYRSWRVANRFQAVEVIVADPEGVDYVIVRDTPRGLEILVRE